MRQCLCELSAFLIDPRSSIVLLLISDPAKVWERVSHDATANGAVCQTRFPERAKTRCRYWGPIGPSRRTPAEAWHAQGLTEHPPLNPCKMVQHAPAADWAHLHWHHICTLGSANRFLHGTTAVPGLLRCQCMQHRLLPCLAPRTSSMALAAVLTGTSTR